MTDEERQRLIAHCKLMLSEHVKYGGYSDDEDIYRIVLASLQAPQEIELRRTMPAYEIEEMIDELCGVKDVANKREIIEKIFRAFNIHRRFKSCRDKQ